MHPIFFELGPLKIHWYGVCMAVAFLLGLANWIWLGRRVGRDAQFCSDLLFWVMVAGIVGGRVAYIVSSPAYYLENPIRVLFLWEGGLIYYGGFAGAILAVFLFARSRRIPFFSLLDFAITSLPLSHAVGRVGCFLNGCCFGDVHMGWPGVRFPALSLPWYRQRDLNLINPDALHSLPVHPVQLYETLLNLLLFPLLHLVFRKRRHHGQVLGAYLIAYPLGRFSLEYLRGTERLLVHGIPMAQVLSLALMLTGIVVLILARRSPALTPPAA